MRLLNPEAVHIDVVHASDERHLLRVTRTLSRVATGWAIVRTDEVDLVPTPLGKVPAATLHICPAGVYVHADRAPSVGNWQGATTDEVLRALSEDAE